MSYITYTLTPNTWHIKMVALATTKKTPIMLSSHVSAQLTRLSPAQADCIDLLELGWFRKSRHCYYRQPHASLALFWPAYWCR